MAHTDPVLAAAKEFLNVLELNQPSRDWEQRIYMFAGTDRRILDRIPLLRHKYNVHNHQIEKMREFIANYQDRLNELN